MNNQIIPTDSELEILQILWQNGPATVRFVNDEINKSREVGYTSTLKTMQLMMDKGMLDRKIEERVHYYIPAIEEDGTKSVLLNEFVEATFNGSPSSLVMNMLGNSSTSTDEINKIKLFIQSLESNSNNN